MQKITKEDITNLYTKIGDLKRSMIGVTRAGYSEDKMSLLDRIIDLEREARIEKNRVNSIVRVINEILVYLGVEESHVEEHYELVKKQNKGSK